jgi:RNase P/RNase MRP subunit p29
MLHQEGDRVTRFSTTETFEGISDRVYEETRCTLIVKRAASGVVVSFFLEWDEIGEYVVDMDGIFYGGGVLDHG